MIHSRSVFSNVIELSLKREKKYRWKNKFDVYFDYDFRSKISSKKAHMKICVVLNFKKEGVVMGCWWKWAKQSKREDINKFSIFFGVGNEKSTWGMWKVF